MHLGQRDSQGLRSRSFDVYFQLTSGLGEYDLGITVGYLADNLTNKTSYVVAHNDRVQRVEFVDPLQVYQGTFLLPSVPLLRLGDYRFSITANGQSIDNGSVNIVIESGEES